MSEPWLHIVGIGEDGMDGLVPATRAVVEAAENPLEVVIAQAYCLPPAR